MRRVLLYGTFDVVHKGHLEFFRQARQHGDHVIAIVARDVNVIKIKGRPPMHDEMKRKKDVEATGLVDEVVLGSLEDPYMAIAEIEPDVIALGYDQAGYADGLSAALDMMGLHPKIVRLEAHEPHKYKSSIIKKEM